MSPLNYQICFKMDKRYRVLVVDDEPLMLDLASKAFTSKGYIVLSAPGGNSALRLIETDVPDLGLIDVVMPGMNGFELLARIRAKVETSKIPIYMFSNSPYKSYVLESIELRATGFISKRELDIKTFLLRIDRITEALDGRKDYDV